MRAAQMGDRESRSLEELPAGSEGRRAECLEAVVSNDHAGRPKA